MKSALAQTTRTLLAKSTLLESCNDFSEEDRSIQTLHNMSEIEKKQSDHSSYQITVTEDVLPYIKKSDLRQSQYDLNEDELEMLPETQNPQILKQIFFKNQKCQWNSKGEDHSNATPAKLQDVLKDLERKLPASNIQLQDEDWTEIPEVRPSDFRMSESSICVTPVGLCEAYEEEKIEAQPQNDNNLSQKLIEANSIHHQNLTYPSLSRIQSTGEDISIIISKQQIQRTLQSQTETLEQEHKSFEQPSRQENSTREYENSQSYTQNVAAQLILENKDEILYLQISTAEQMYSSQVTTQFISDLREYFLLEFRILLPQSNKIQNRKVLHQLFRLFVNFTWDKYPEEMLSFLKYNLLSSPQKQNPLLKKKQQVNHLQQKDFICSQETRKLVNLLTKMLTLNDKLSMNRVTLQRLTQTVIEEGHNEKLRYEIIECLALVEWIIAFDKAQLNMQNKLKLLQELRNMQAYIKADICKEEINSFKFVKKQCITLAKQKIQHYIQKFFPIR